MIRIHGSTLPELFTSYCNYIISSFTISELIISPIPSTVDNNNNRQSIHSLSAPENLSDESIIMNESTPTPTPNNTIGSVNNNKNYWNYDSNIYFQWFADLGSGIYLVAHDSNSRTITGTIMGEYKWINTINGENKNIKQSFYSPISIPHSTDSTSTIPLSTPSSSSSSDSSDYSSTPEMKESENRNNKTTKTTTNSATSSATTTPSLLTEIDICDQITLRISNVYESYI